MTPEATPETTPETTKDLWEERVLCADEGCIGLVGPDGRCKVCGLMASGLPADRQVAEVAAVQAAAEAAPAGEHEDVDFDQRQLCPDGACTGVLGEDGRCKICGNKNDK